jgi:hypothetical protein
VPVDDARAYLEEGNPTRLFDILDELFHPQVPPVDYNTILKQCVAIFCILIDMEMGASIQDFVIYGLNDQKLPFDSRQEPPPGFPPDTGAGGFYGLFCKCQWRFCVPLFEKNMARVFEVDRILPIASWEKVADGSSGSIIHAIRLHSSYNQLSGHTSMV